MKCFDVLVTKNQQTALLTINLLVTLITNQSSN